MTTNPTTWRGVYRGVPATCRVLTDLDGVESWARDLGATYVEVSANGVDIDETWFQRGDTVVHIEGAGFLPYDTESAIEMFAATAGVDAARATDNARESDKEPGLGDSPDRLSANMAAQASLAQSAAAIAREVTGR